MEHAINHFLRFKIYLKWLFHTIYCLLKIKYSLIKKHVVKHIYGQKYKYIS